MKKETRQSSTFLKRAGLACLAACQTACSGDEPANIKPGNDASDVATP